MMAVSYTHLDVYKRQELERQAQQAAQAATTFACPFCGARMGVSNLFCSGCGKPIAEIQDAFAAQQQADAPVASTVGPACPACGAPVVQGDAFCLSLIHLLNISISPVTSNFSLFSSKIFKHVLIIFCPCLLYTSRCV